MKKKKSIKREVTEWLVFIGIIGFLYLSGLYAPVMGTLQGLVLKTGLIRPDTEENITSPAEYDMMLIDEHQKQVSLTQFKGKTIFLNFWATWCPPCIAEMPDINALYQSLDSNEDIIFVLVSFDDDFKRALTYKEKKGYDLPIYSLASPLPEAYASKAIPTSYVIAPNGKIVVRKQGMAQYNTSDFRQFLLDLNKSN